MIDADRHARLTDFGLSKIVVSKRSFSLCGTPQFVAPEMVSPSRPLTGYDKMVDWWSLGVMMHEMACSKLPFEDTNWEALQRKITVETPLFPAAIQEKKLTTVLNGLLTKDARKRFCLAEMKKDVFYSGLNWQKLMDRQVEAPK